MERKFEEIVGTEKLFLGCILQNFKSIYSVMDLLNASDFFWEKHSKIYSAMLEFATKGIECDAFKLWSHFQERNENFVERNYIFDIYENGLGSGADYYAKLIKNNSIARKRHEFHSRSLSMLNYGAEDLESVFEEIDKNHFMLQKEIKKSCYIKESEAIDRAVNYWADKNSKGVPTGFSDLDNFIVEIEKGQLVILAASTSMGKSALATNIATNLALMGKSVFFFSFEMKIEDIVMRQACSKAMLNSRALKRMDIGAMEGELERTLAELRKVNLVMNESPNMNFAEMQSRCQQKKFESGLDFIVIDYLQLIRPDKAENRTIAVGDISRKIKLMAIELSVPILCLSQLNRDVFKGSQEPELFHLRDSGNIEQDADHVWFIVRKNKEDREAMLKIAKNRNGRLGRIPLEYLPEYFLFRDCRPA